MGKTQYELEERPIIEESLSASDQGGEFAVSTKIPCTISGLGSAVGGGLLGYVFGFGGKLIGTRKLSPCHAAAMQSAKQFALIGGLYAVVSCFAVRIRQKEDAWTSGISGCATGLALGWAGGPAAALRGCAGFGAVSAVLDSVSRNPAQADTGRMKTGVMRNRGCSSQGCRILAIPRIRKRKSS